MSKICNQTQVFCIVFPTLLKARNRLLLIPKISDGTVVMPGQHKLCQIDGEIKTKTMLEGGMLAGKLVSHKGTKDITSCIRKCCETENCHVAMMMGTYCYSVSCLNSDFCRPKAAPKETHHQNPTIAYVKRGQITFGR